MIGRLALLLALTGAPALAQDAVEIARWGENSGSLAPEYAWDYDVVFYSDGMVVAKYCKGYAESAPGCATVKKTLKKADLAALNADLAPYLPDLASNPPVMAEEVPVGGGSIGGRVIVAGQEIYLYAYPDAKDVERVGVVLEVLQDHTPPRLVKKAERRAKQP